MSLEILYQDEDLIVVNKPSGLLVHRTELAKEEEDAVVQRLRDQTGRWVFPVHRLDRGTSGALLLAFSPEIARQLSVQFSEARVSKNYYCLVRGFCDTKGVIDYPLAKLNEIKGRSRFKIEGTEKEAITEYELVKRFQLPVPVSRYNSMRLSWLKVIPKQGRKHQIRRHFKHLLNPLVGDTRYGCRHINKACRELWTQDLRLMLHASQLTFEHPTSNESVSVAAPLSTELQTILDSLASYEC
ncbi:pseudouridine synthase [Marinomonas sp.]